jgi:hypothetical protein
LSEACNEFETRHSEFTAHRKDLKKLKTKEVLSAVKFANAKKGLKASAETFKGAITNVLKRLEQDQEDIKSTWSGRVASSLSDFYPFARFCVGLADTAGEVMPISLG